MNTTLSYAFRATVTLHLACLFVLFFVMTNTLIGRPHELVAGVLTVLMALAAIFFVADMVTRKDERRKNAKVIDGVIGTAWLILIGFLLVNSLRAGRW